MNGCIHLINLDQKKNIHHDLKYGTSQHQNSRNKPLLY